MFKQIIAFNKKLEELMERHIKTFNIDTKIYDFKVVLITNSSSNYIIIKIYKDDIENCVTYQSVITLEFDNEGNFSHSEDSTDELFPMSEIEDNLFIESLLSSILFTVISA